MDVKEAGKKGGQKTLSKLGVDHFKRIARISAESRKKNAQAKENL